MVVASLYSHVRKWLHLIQWSRDALPNFRATAKKTSGFPGEEEEGMDKTSQCQIEIKMILARQLVSEYANVR